MDTPIFRHAANYTGRQPKPVPPVIDPDRVVRAIVRSVEHPRRQRTVGEWGRLLEIGHAVAPSVFNRLVPTAMKLAALGRRHLDDSPGNVFEPMPEWNKVDGDWRNPAARAGVAAVGVAIVAGLCPLVLRHLPGRFRDIAPRNRSAIDAQSQ